MKEPIEPEWSREEIEDEILDLNNALVDLRKGNAKLRAQVAAARKWLAHDAARVNAEQRNQSASLVSSSQRNCWEARERFRELLEKGDEK